MELVYVCRAELSESFDSVLEMLSDDPVLIEALNKYSLELEEEGIEIFHKQKNIMAAENGYYIACYEKDITYGKNNP
jgi:hypothetical protein